MPLTDTAIRNAKSPDKPRKLTDAQLLEPLGPYQIGTFWGDIGDHIVESFAGDFIGGELPGFYDSEGNTSRGRGELSNVAANTWTVAAIPIAAPFAASEMVSPELLQFILSAH